MSQKPQLVRGGFDPNGSFSLANKYWDKLRVTSLLTDRVCMSHSLGSNWCCAGRSRNGGVKCVSERQVPRVSG
jgi:hypothetical protein